MMMVVVAVTHTSFPCGCILWLLVLPNLAERHHHGLVIEDVAVGVLQGLRRLPHAWEGHKRLALHPSLLHQTNGEPAIGGNDALYDLYSAQPDHHTSNTALHDPYLVMLSLSL